MCIRDSTGSLAPEGAVVKSAGFDSDVFEGTARVFDGERAAMDAVEDGTMTAGDVVVIRYEGPKGGPGMREMLAVTGAIKGAGLGKDVLLLTDCLLYTSDAADERSSVDLGGRRIIKKKTDKNNTSNTAQENRRI